jgi:hypothetical protein
LFWCPLHPCYEPPAAGCFLDGRKSLRSNHTSDIAEQHANHIDLSKSRIGYYIRGVPMSSPCQATVRRIGGSPKLVRIHYAVIPRRFPGKTRPPTSPYIPRVSLGQPSTSILSTTLPATPVPRVSLLPRFHSWIGPQKSLAAGSLSPDQIHLHISFGFVLCWEENRLGSLDPSRRLHAKLKGTLV